MSKQYKEGDIFEVIVGCGFAKGSIVVLSDDDGSKCPKFDLIKGHCYHAKGVYTKMGAYAYYANVRRIWPEEKKETVELNGKTYLKEDLEEALKHLKPVE